MFKIIWHEFALFVFAYALLSCLYRFLLIPHSKEAKQTFELICISAEKIMTQGRTLITFLTGFYVTQVINRWWKQFMTLPWPDRLALKVANFIPGNVSILHYYLIYTLILIYAKYILFLRLFLIHNKNKLKLKLQLHSYFLCITFIVTSFSLYSYSSFRNSKH